MKNTHTYFRRFFSALSMLVLLSGLMTLSGQNPCSSLTNLAIGPSGTAVGPTTITFKSGNGTVCNGTPSGYEIWLIVDGVCTDLSGGTGSEQTTAVIPAGSTYSLIAAHPNSNGNPNFCDVVVDDPGCTLTCPDPCQVLDPDACACVDNTPTCSDPCQVLDPATCMCVDNTPMCDFTCEIFDPATCSCIPEPQDCPDPCQSYDPVVCGCVDMTPTCNPTCEVFNPATCACDPVPVPTCDPTCEVYDASICACVPVVGCSALAGPFVCDDGDPCTENDVFYLDACSLVSTCTECAGTPIVETKICESEPNRCDRETNSVTVLVCEECPFIEPPVCLSCPNTTCPPCFSPNPDNNCECEYNPTTNCFPVACDDGDPCTANDVAYQDCFDNVCVPCQGEQREITKIQLINNEDCGAIPCGPGQFKADIEITFNHAPVFEDFIITGDIYFSYKEKYCSVRGNKLIVKDRCFDGDGELIKLNVIFNDRLSCSSKRVKIGTAPICGAGNKVAQTNFNAFKQDRHVDLEWVTNQTYKSSKYILEKSVDGVNFTELQEVSNTVLSEDLEYFTGSDMTPVYGENFYRLKSVFTNGTFEYSDIQKVDFTIDLDAISFFPNPAENELYIDLDEFAGKSGHLIISNQFGQIMGEMDFDEIPSDLIQVDLSTYVNGLYFIRTKVDRSQYVAKKIIISKLY